MKRHEFKIATIGTALLLLLPAIAAAQPGTLFVEGERVGIGTATPTEKLHVFEDTNGNTFVTSENTSGGASAAGVLRARSNVAVVNFQAHGGGRTISRFGETLGGWAEFLQVSGNGLIVGTFSAKPLVLGTNSTNVLEITPAGDVLYKGSTVHSDYVFEPDYELPSIGDNADFMWRNKHLMAIGPAVYSEDGREMMSLGSDRQAIVEELEKAHIYIAQLHERLESSDQELDELQQQNLEVLKANVALQERLGRLEELVTRPR